MCRLNEKCALRYSCQTQVNSTNRYITYIKGPGTDGSIKASAFKWKQDNALELEKVHYFLLNNRKILIRSVSSSDLWRGGSVGSGSWLLLRRPNLSSLGVLAGGPFAANLGSGHLAIHLKYRCNENKEIYLQPLINVYIYVQIYTGLRIRSDIDRIRIQPLMTNRIRIRIQPLRTNRIRSGSMILSRPDPGPDNSVRSILWWF